jgi:hypothetical protein
MIGLQKASSSWQFHAVPQLGETESDTWKAMAGRSVPAKDAAVGGAQLELAVYATPITYRGRNGKQYVVILAAGGGYYARQSGVQRFAGRSQ